MAGYIRQDTTNNIANGNIINANDLDNEYDAIAAAFGAITGHKHDGTDAEGAPITKVGPVQDVVVSSTAVTPKTDNTVDLGSSTSEFKDLYIDGVANIDSLVADTADINAGTIDNASVGATTPSTGAFTTLTSSSTTTLNGTSIPASKTLLVSTDIGVSVQGYDADLAAFALKTAPTGDVVGTSDAQTLTNKTIALGSNTVSGTIAQFNTAVTDADFATLDGAETLTNKTLTAPVVSGDLTVADKIVHAGDTNTAVRFPAADTVTIETDGVERVRIDSSGNLGIGTSSPNALLDVRGSIRAGYSGIIGTTMLEDNYTNTDSLATIGVMRSSGALLLGSGVKSAENAIGLVSSTGISYSRASLALVSGNFVFSSAGASTVAVGSAISLTERARIDSSGNLGVGVIPSAWGSGSKAIEFGFSGSALFASSANNTSLLSNAYYNGTNFIYASSNAASRYQQTAGSHQWLTASSGTAGNTISFTEAMKLDASGNLLVGTTSLPTTATTTTGFGVGPEGNVASYCTSNGAAWGRGNDGVVHFFRRGTTGVGSISINSTSTTYATSSDYRLKHNIAPMQGALSRVQQLKPVTYKWNADNSDGEGFIAHELAEVCPQAVTGEKDAVDADGKPVYQGIDTSFLVATLTAAIQEQQAIITELRSRIEVLEAK